MATVSRHLKIIAWSVIDGLFPLECVSCGRPRHYCCPTCLSAVSTLVRMPRRPRGTLDSLRVGYAYANPLIGRLIREWKYGGHGVAGDAIGSLTERWLEKHAGALPSVDTVVAVPLHHRRLRERGFNQADSMAAAVAACAGAQVRSGHLIRRSPTLPQAEIDLTEGRFANVRGVFFADPQAFRGRSILLVDDVCTTGATLGACAAALKSSGAAKVHGFALSGALHRMEKTLE